MSRYADELKRANIPEGEISIIVHNLEKLEAQRVSGDKISIIVHNLVKKPRFKQSFMKDPVKAAESIGIIVHN